MRFLRGCLLSLLLIAVSAHPAAAAAATVRDGQPTAAPMAVFPPAYQAQHRGRIRYAVPEVYELVNIVIALTPLAAEQEGLVARGSAYHQEVQAHFGRFRDDPVVLAFDREMRQGLHRYFALKMNGNAFEFDPAGGIRRSRIYHRTGFEDQPNALLPHVERLEQFSRRSGFRAFYAAHRSLYRSQVETFDRDVDATSMLKWLREQFPRVRSYDTVSVVFSPLVSANQSATWLENDGFSELQLHMNFPYPRSSNEGFSPRAVAVRRGILLFTEMNHGFINPTAALHAGAIEAAIRDRAWWTREGSPGSGYGDKLPFFNEMMNWGLVSLYMWDRVDPSERERLIAILSPNMERRGFSYFAPFNRFLVDLYANRKPGTTVADLYPAIIAWFAENEGALSAPA